LRVPHEIFRSPRSIDVKKTVSLNTPDAWKDALRERTVDVLPLARDPNKQHRPGWCTYTYEHEQAPELEVLCGGVNSKTPTAGAIWRQGNLLHFGFDLAPSEMNDAGQALLVNSIAYIARFTEDRPIVRTPSVFAGGIRIFDRGAVGRAVAGGQEGLKRLEWYLAKKTHAEVKGKSVEEVADWFQEVRDYLRADPAGALSVDVEARSFGVPPNGSQFFEKTIAAFTEPDRAAAARKLLDRYAPDGPGSEASAEKWRAWLRGNGPYLFFSDTGGCRWLIDSLAKKKIIPSARLRGPARATLPPLKPGDNGPVEAPERRRPQ
jgi:hypothetical protein